MAATASCTSSGAAPDAGVAVADVISGASFSITRKWSNVTSIGPSLCCGPIAIRPMPGVPVNGMDTEPGVSTHVSPSALIWPVYVSPALVSRSHHVSVGLAGGAASWPPGPVSPPPSS